MTSQSKLPENNIFADMTDRIEFTVTDDMVAGFARLSGDFSSLHTDKAFGRRSMYRQNVVHGMLTVMFITAFKEWASAESKLIVRTVSAAFLGPVFVNDRLLLSVETCQSSGANGQVQIEYTVRNVSSDNIVTTGRLELEPAEAEQNSKKNCPRQVGSDIPPLVTEAITEEKLRFDDIEKGDEKQLLFKITEEHAAALHGIVSQGLGSCERPERLGRPIADSMLATCLFSTFAGMCIPGKYATLLDIQVEFQKPVERDRNCIFKGKVGFKSNPTSTVVEDVSICAADEPSVTYATGKIKVKVNDPPIEMPTVKFLRDKHGDSGLKDKVVLITGGSRGIGETTAKLFSVHGAKVAVSYYRGEQDANRIVDEIAQDGGRAIAVQADVSDRQQIKLMIAAVRDKYGALDVLVNNAVGDFAVKSFMDLTWQDLQQEIDVTVKGAFNCCQEALPSMLDSGKGAIVNISTVWVENPPPQQTKYVVAKSGLVGLTRSLAAEFAGNGIRVNMVSPSMVRTDSTQYIPKLRLNGIKKSTPMQRLACPAEVAKAVVFLASDAASFTTGQKMMVTGGNPPFL